MRDKLKGKRIMVWTFMGNSRMYQALRDYGDRALAGPVGWTIAGVMLAGSVGSGLFASHKNKKTANKLIAERENLEKIIRKFNNMNSEVTALVETTRTQIVGVSKAEKALIGSDYSQFSKDEKMQAGLLVNSTLTLAQLINKDLKLND